MFKADCVQCQTLVELKKHNVSSLIPILPYFYYLPAVLQENLNLHPSYIFCDFRALDSSSPNGPCVKEYLHTNCYDVILLAPIRKV